MERISPQVSSRSSRSTWGCVVWDTQEEAGRQEECHPSRQDGKQEETYERELKCFSIWAKRPSSRNLGEVKAETNRIYLYFDLLHFTLYLTTPPALLPPF